MEPIVAKQKTPSTPERLRVSEDECSALRPQLLGANFSFNSNYEILQT